MDDQEYAGYALAIGVACIIFFLELAVAFYDL
jgi:hypothetical protein